MVFAFDNEDLKLKTLPKRKSLVDKLFNTFANSSLLKVFTNKLLGLIATMYSPFLFNCFELSMHSTS